MGIGSDPAGLQLGIRTKLINSGQAAEDVPGLENFSQLITFPDLDDYSSCFENLLVRRITPQSTPASAKITRYSITGIQVI